jgi:hypothetical protein
VKCHSRPKPNALPELALRELALRELALRIRQQNHPAKKAA